MLRMRRIIECIKKAVIFDWDKYWKRRTAFFNAKKNSLKYFYLQFWLKRQGKKYSADIGLDYGLGDAFAAPLYTIRMESMESSLQLVRKSGRTVLFLIRSRLKEVEMVRR